MVKQAKALPQRLMEPKKRHRLTHGEGSFYYREKDSRWVGTIEAGTNEDGKRRRIVVTHKDEDRAWDKLTEKRKVLITQGRAAALTGSATVSTWCKRWLKIQESRLRPSSYAGAASYVKQWIIPQVGKVNIEDVTADHVRKVARAVIDKGRSTTTAATVQGVFQKILRDALIEGYQVAQAPMELPRPKKQDTRGRTAIPLEQCWQFVRYADQAPRGSRWLLAFLQGMRPAEVLGLTWDAVDFNAGTIDVSWQLKKLPYKVARDPASGFRYPDGYEARHLEMSYHLVRPKSSAGHRVIPLIPWMSEHLRAWKNASPKSSHDLVYTRADGKPEIDKADTKAWKRVQDELGLWKSAGDPPTYWDAYEIRHSTATLLLDAKVDPEIVKAIMGHSDIAVTAGYQHVNMEMMRLALEAVREKLQSPEPRPLLTA